MLEAITTLQSWPPRLSKVGALLLKTGREETNGAVMPTPKVAPLPALIFIPFKTLALACVNFIITMPEPSLTLGVDSQTEQCAVCPNLT